jgi:hypothetical protein
MTKMYSNTRIVRDFLALKKGIANVLVFFPAGMLDTPIDTNMRRELETRGGERGQRLKTSMLEGHESATTLAEAAPMRHIRKTTGTETGTGTTGTETGTGTTGTETRGHASTITRAEVETSMKRRGITDAEEDPRGGYTPYKGRFH